MTKKDVDVLVVGAGPGGLAAAKAACENGAKKVVVLERNHYAGGILERCIHDGFGLIRYSQALTGPEYAIRAYSEAIKAGADVLLGRHVTDISEDKTVTAYTKNGPEKYKAKAIVLATGCRERTRGSIAIPGSRPAGVFTAGVAQRLVNRQNVMVGKNVVILGSGDIGLIMARRLTLEGARVLAVAEIMPEPCGLARNVSQCLYDYDIPLYVSTTVIDIIGKKRVEAVKLAKVDENKIPVPGTERLIECDTLILSVGLIPENEVALTCGISLNGNNGVITDEYLQTNIEGIFACGNSRHVMDLADYVSEQGETAGKNSASYLLGTSMKSWDESKSNCMKKGFPEEDTVTCSICPNGCQVKYEKDYDSYSGNKCPRGVVFARQEMSAPVRTVTTSIRSKGGRMLSVRSNGHVPKDEVRAFVQAFSKTQSGTVFAGDRITVSLKNGSLAEMIVCDNICGGL